MNWNFSLNVRAAVIVDFWDARTVIEHKMSVRGLLEYADYVCQNIHEVYSVLCLQLQCCSCWQMDAVQKLKSWLRFRSSALSHGIAKFVLTECPEDHDFDEFIRGLFWTWSYCSIYITLIHDMNLNLPCGDCKESGKTDARGAPLIINFKLDLLS